MLERLATQGVYHHADNHDENHNHNHDHNHSHGHDVHNDPLWIPRGSSGGRVRSFRRLTRQGNSGESSRDDELRELKRAQMGSIERVQAKYVFIGHAPPPLSLSLSWRGALPNAN